MDSQADWMKAAGQFQENLGAGWKKALESFQQLGGGMAPGTAGSMAGSLPNALMNGMPSMPALHFDPAKLLALQKAYIEEASQLWNQGLQPQQATDKRFAGDAWGRHPLASFSASVYLLNTRTLMGLVEAADADEKTKARLRFAIEQWAAATAPSNFLALNPDAQQKAIETKGESIARGMQNLLNDIQQGHVSMTDESVFEVGRNMATTEGAVVFENELFQLIEYKPRTAKVFERPFLLVPPCINKFYILDLQPENSFVAHLVDQGHHVFLVSWRSADASMAQVTWDDYIEDGAIRAIETVREITQAKDINALGFCVGGTILGTALAVLAGRKQKPVHSATFLTSFLDFSHTGVMDVFIDEAFVKFREMQLGKGGILPGRDLAQTFSFLRPNDLVWNYVVGNYLKGETPPPFDLLYWNSDSTNLPGPMYAWYLRNTYLENNLIKPGKVTVCGQKLDLRKIDMPIYFYGSREDHIVPIEGAYESAHHTGGRKRFVMGASGHIAGVINAPEKKKRSYWTNDKLPRSHADWVKGAKEHPGSWWPDWYAWLKPLAGKQVAAPRSYGRGKFKAIEPAPGRYVKAKA